MKKIQVLYLKEGAEEARGITVIIDVFRAFSMEAWLFHKGMKQIYVTGDTAEARRLKAEHPDYVLLGEREGKILPGFDYGNSPSAVYEKDFTGKTAVHTTTNGTQGIVNASHASQIIMGALVNASATAAYIRAQKEEEVSLVCMGWESRRTEEDQLCADYLSALIQEKPFPELNSRIEALKHQEGKKFFDPAQQSVFPEKDFYLCTKPDLFDFAICLRHENQLLVNRKVLVKHA